MYDIFYHNYDKTYSLFMYTMSYKVFLIILIFFTVYKILSDLAYEPYTNMYNRSCGYCGKYEYHRPRGLPEPIKLYEPYEVDSTNGSDQNTKISDQQNDMMNIKNEIQKIKAILDKLYESDLDGKYLTHGWFVEFHNVVDHPKGIILGEGLGKIHSAPYICFRAKESFPFLGTPENPIYFPKADNVGIRAMTVFKIPKTGYYDFRILSDDGLRFYYQKVDANIILNEKNARSQWIMIIDRWVTQAENWKISKKIYFNQNELILLRMDYYEMGIFATACIKMRYYLDNDQVEESDPPFENTFCSLLWSEVPLLGVP